MGIQSNISPSQSKNSTKEMDEALREWIETHRTFTDIFLDAYAIVDVTNRVVDFNVAFTELCGYSYRKMFKIGHFCELLRTEHCPHQCPAKQILTSERALRLDELSGTSKAKPNLKLIMGGIPIFSPKKQLLGALLTIRDVTDEDNLQKKYTNKKIDSVTDGLTQMYNKAFSEAFLLKTVRTALRELRPFTVIMCDIDHFKKKNDNYGHQAGDFVLSKVAQILKQEVRGSDIVGRVGGEEFMIILHNCDQKGSGVLAERVRSLVESYAFKYEGNTIPCTMSFGTATFYRGWEEGTNPEWLAKEVQGNADKALYFSKENGRNQVTHFEELKK